MHTHGSELLLYTEPQFLCKTKMLVFIPRVKKGTAGNKDPAFNDTAPAF